MRIAHEWRTSCAERSAHPFSLIGSSKSSAQRASGAILWSDEATLTTTPRLPPSAAAVRSRGSSSCVSKKWPSWWTPKFISQPCADTLRCGCIPPALHTSASTRLRPVTFVNVSTKARTDAQSAMSSAAKTALADGAPVVASASAIAARARASVRHAKTTVAPRRRRWRAVSRPMPAELPVTTTTQPSRRIGGEGSQMRTRPRYADAHSAADARHAIDDGTRPGRSCKRRTAMMCT